MNTIEIRPESGLPEPNPAAHEGLGREVLIQNAVWFTQIRWMVIALLLAGGALALGFPWVLEWFGIRPPGRWPVVLASLLALLNLGYAAHLRRVNDRSPRRIIEFNLWTQIVADLGAVTFLVHHAGSTQTFAAFTYLFHVILACVFFPPRRSLIVTGLAAILYLGCVLLEALALIPPPLPLPAHEGGGVPPGWVLASAGSAVAAWFIIWYLASTLSERVRERDLALTEANARLLAADAEKNRRVLQITHDLKAPFSGIESNVQLLRYMHWESLSPPVKELMSKIETRSHTLRERINDILALGRLRTQTDLPLGPVDLKPVIDDVVQDLSERAEARRIRLTLQIPDFRVRATPEALKIILLNLVSNAVSYSHEGGDVTVRAEAAGDTVRIAVQDHGIGISDDALPRIFDEYFRTGEAVQFNRTSSGLGLAIVKEAATRIGAGLRVTSEQGKGSTFEVLLPAADR